MRRNFLLLAGTAAFLLLSTLSANAGQEPPQPENAPVTTDSPPSPDTQLERADTPEEITDNTNANAEIADEDTNKDNTVVESPSYGLWVLVPPLVAIILAILTRQVIPALAVSILVAGYMVQFMPSAAVTEQFSQTPGLVRGLRIAVEGFFIGALYDQDHLQIIVFTLLVGGMVGVLAANGGTRAMVQSVSRWASTGRKGQFLGWLAGLVVFFDDYANSMIVGPTMAPIYDKLKVSRQKLAYIVDSTAAPIASLAPIGTWIAAEVGFIDSGLKSLGANTPAFLADADPYWVFIYSIPYRFYALFALLLVAIIALSGRDFGAMRKEERRAFHQGQSQASGLDEVAPMKARWWHAGGPIIALMLLTLVLLIVTDKNAYLSIMYGAIGSLLLAFGITIATKTLDIKRLMDAMIEGMSRMFPAIVVLVLAWGLSTSLNQDNLGLAQVAQQWLGSQGLQMDVTFLPITIFLVAAVVSFSTGTSWGTMGILCPVAVTLSAGLIGNSPDAAAQAHLFYASVGAVLAGAVFGDHCSPISDTTVLSAIASGCSLESHVWTQLPYALLAAVAAIVCGDILSSHYHQPVWLALLAGTALMTIIVFLLGRRTPAVETKT